MNNPIIEPENRLLITDIPGYTPNISRLICMMNFVRHITLRSVKDITVKELDYLHDESSNSIGALLHHIAAGDFYNQKMSLEGRELSEEEYEKWKAPLELGEEGQKKIKGNDLDYYITILNEVRNRTYELLKEKDDVWLEKRSPIGKIELNNYMLWFHVFEDEINHRGQISWLRKRAKNLKKTS